MLTGEKISLRSLESEDMETLRSWRNRADFRKYFREYREINSDMQLNWYNQTVLSNQQTFMFAIIDANSEELLGCCGLCYVNWVHRHADLSLYIGWEDNYIDDRGYAEEACYLLFKYAFHQLGLNKIWTEIYEFDKKKRGLYENLGFSIDGTLRKNYFYDGKYWDSLILSFLSEEFITKEA